MTAPVTVTQADREAAAAYYYSAGGCQNIANLIRSGERDGWFRVQAFARHRTQSAAASNAQVAELVEAVEMLLAPLERASAAMVAHGKAADANVEATFDYVHAILVRAKATSDGEGV